MPPIVLGADKGVELELETSRQQLVWHFGGTQMSGVTITIEDDLLRELRISSDRAEEQLRLELAVQLVATGIATPAQGSRLAKQGRLDFLKELGKRHVSIVGGVEEHQEDLGVIRGLASP